MPEEQVVITMSISTVKGDLIVVQAPVPRAYAEEAENQEGPRYWLNFLMEAVNSLVSDIEKYEEALSKGFTPEQLAQATRAMAQMN